MIETKEGLFEIIKDDSNSFVVADFDNRFIPYLRKYEFIVGDYSQGLLRLKGFNKDSAKFIPDYINEYCALDHQYYILRNPNFDINYKEEEEEI